MKNRHLFKYRLTALLLALCLALAAAGCDSAPASQPTGTPADAQSGQAQSAAAESQPEPGLPFPYTPEGSLLEVQTLFQFSGFNPDCDGAEGANTAAIQVKNISVKHIASAEVLAQLATGETLRFVLQDLPAQGAAMVFEANNAQLAADAVCEAITCTFTAEDETPVMAGQLTAEPGEMMVTLTNVSGQDLPELTVYCHSIFDGWSFGGVTYAYPVPALAAGQSAEVITPDCYLDSVQVVRVEQVQ